MGNDLISAVELPELFRIPAVIDWSHGRNRADGKLAQIEAQDDMAAINDWLKTYQASRETFKSYRKEAIRLFLWSVHARGKSISDLSHTDMLAYQDFIKDPQPASKWVSQPDKPTKPGETPRKPAKVSISDPRWRPFYGPLSPVSQRQTVVILNTMFAWLVDAGYLAGNPLSLSRTRNRTVKGNKRLSRSLDPEQIDMVLSVISRLPADTASQRKTNARLRWAVALLYLTGLRISEAVKNSMGGFHQVPGPGGTRQWWLDVTGKGNREDEIPVTPDLLRELKAYRDAFGLSSLPIPGEQIPLIFSLGPSRKAITRQTLHKVLEFAFDEAATQFRNEGLANDADRLEAASAHWLRHSLGTNLVRQGMNIAQVRDVMRHANIATTNIYVHTDADARHSEMIDKHTLPEKES